MKEIYAYARTEMFKTNGFTAIAINNGDSEKAEKTYAGGTSHIGNIHANELSTFLNFVESVTEEYEEHLNIHIAGISQGLKKLLSCNDKNKNLLFADYLASGNNGSELLEKELVVNYAAQWLAFYEDRQFVTFVFDTIEEPHIEDLKNKLDESYYKHFIGFQAKVIDDLCKELVEGSKS